MQGIAIPALIRNIKKDIQIIRNLLIVIAFFLNVIKVAMIEVDKALKEGKFKTKMVLQINPIEKGPNGPLCHFTASYF